MKFGLLGRTLGHSFSPRIHSALGNTNYELFEREPSQLQEFFADPELQGINITIPYKVNALEACDVVDPRAERIGCVNTMVRKDGKWHGYNTDYDGFVFTLQHAGIDVSGKECIILGDGASSATVHVALEDLGAKNITFISLVKRLHSMVMRLITTKQHRLLLTAHLSVCILIIQLISSILRNFPN